MTLHNDPKKIVRPEGISDAQWAAHLEVVKEAAKEHPDNSELYIQRTVTSGGDGGNVGGDAGGANPS